MENISMNGNAGRDFDPNYGHGEEFGVADPNKSENRSNEEHDLSVDTNAINAFLLVDLVKQEHIAAVVGHVAENEKPELDHLRV